MPQNYTGNASAVAVGAPVVIAEPVGSDSPNAASVSGPLETLANHIAAVSAGALRKLAVALASSADLKVTTGIAGSPEFVIACRDPAANRWVIGGGTNGAGQANLAYFDAPGRTVTAAATNPLVNADGDITGIAKLSGGTWAAVTSAGRVLTSANQGVDWTMRTAAGGTTVYQLLRSNGSLFVAGYNAGLQTSGDGITWTQRLAVTGTVRDVKWNGSQWIAIVHTTGDNTERIYSSTDGITWTVRHTFSAGANTHLLTYLQGRWVDMYFTAGPTTTAVSSTDGITWSAATAAPQSYGGAASYTRASQANGMAIAMNSNFLFLVTVDGLTWTFADPPAVAVADIGAVLAPDAPYLDPTFGRFFWASGNGNIFFSRFGVAA